MWLWFCCIWYGTPETFSAHSHEATNSPQLPQEKGGCAEGTLPLGSAGQKRSLPHSLHHAPSPQVILTSDSSQPRALGSLA